MAIFEVRIIPDGSAPADFAASARDLPRSLDDWLRKEVGGSCIGRVTTSVGILEITAPDMDCFRPLIDAYVDYEQRHGRRTRAVISQKHGSSLGRVFKPDSWLSFC